jgi:hypothetical protein
MSGSATEVHHRASERAPWSTRRLSREAPAWRGSASPSPEKDFPDPRRFYGRDASRADGARSWPAHSPITPA